MPTDVRLPPPHTQALTPPCWLVFAAAELGAMIGVTHTVLAVALRVRVICQRHAMCSAKAHTPLLQPRAAPEAGKAKDAPSGIEPGEDAVDAIATAISNGLLSHAALEKKIRKERALQAGASPPVVGAQAREAVVAEDGDVEEGPQEFFS